MAKQNINLPASGEDRGSSRRNSIGKASSSDGGEQILSRYLQASTGSCHDLCKFGRKHGFEEKVARRSFPQRMTKKLPHDEYLLEFQPEKPLVAKQKIFPDSKTHSSGTSEISESDISTKSIDRQHPAFGRVLARGNTSAELVTKSLDSDNAILRKVMSKKKKSTEIMKSHDKLSPSAGVALSSKKTSLQKVMKEPVGKQGLARSETSSGKKATAQGKKKASVAKLSNFPDPKAHLASRVIYQDAPAPEKADVVLGQASSKAVKTKSLARHANPLKPELSSPGSSKVQSGRRNSDVKPGQKTITPKIAIKRVVQASPRASLSSGVAIGLASPRASSKASLIKVASINARKHRGLKVVSSLKSQNDVKEADGEQPKIDSIEPYHHSEELKEPANDIVQEKTLYVIETEVGRKHLVSDRNENVSDESSPPPLSPTKSPFATPNHEGEEDPVYFDTESEYDESEYMEDEEDFEAEEEDEEGFKAEHRAKLIKAGKVSLHNKDDQPRKLRFRRGKIVEIISENNGPRRLKFRRGRVLGENQNLKADGRRVPERGGVDDDSVDAIPDSEKVVLRHQNVHGKKDAQGLFNNVIEETASKLVETRKSKVKALVGAFETVISLQDIKPSANSVP